MIIRYQKLHWVKVLYIIIQLILKIGYLLYIAAIFKLYNKKTL